MEAPLKASTLAHCFQHSQPRVHSPAPMPVDSDVEQVEEIYEYIHVAHPGFQRASLPGCINSVDEVVENSAEEEQRILGTYEPAPLHESDSDSDETSGVPATVNSRYKHTAGARGDMLIANIYLYREKLVTYMGGPRGLKKNEGHAYNEYMLIPGMFITRVDCIPYKAALEGLEALCLFRLQHPHLSAHYGEQLEALLYRDKRDIKGPQ